jgi:hypothetical protein
MENKKSITEMVALISDTNTYATLMYTKEDVLRILDDIKPITNGTLSEEQIKDLKTNVRRCIESIDKTEVVDESGFEFDIRNNNEIYCSDFHFNEDVIVDNVMDKIDEFFNDLDED